MNRTLITVNGQYKGDCSCGYMSLAIQAGRSKERAAIVAWLRAKAERAYRGERDPQDSLVGDFATWIEHGDHLRGDDE